MEIDGHRLNVGISVGICVLPDQTDSVEQLIHFADFTMYEAKKRPGRGYRFFGPGQS